MATSLVTVTASRFFTRHLVMPVHESHLHSVQICILRGQTRNQTHSTHSQRPPPSHHQIQPVRHKLSRQSSDCRPSHRSEAGFTNRDSLTRPCPACTAAPERVAVPPARPSSSPITAGPQAVPQPWVLAPIYEKKNLALLVPCFARHSLLPPAARHKRSESVFGAEKGRVMTQWPPL